MSIIISPFTLQQTSDRLSRLAAALDHTATTLNLTTETGEDFLYGTSSTIRCFAENVREAAAELEQLAYWAEEANIQIIYQRFFGAETRIEVYKYTNDGPEVMLTTIKPDEKGKRHDHL